MDLSSLSQYCPSVTELALSKFAPLDLTSLDSKTYLKKLKILRRNKAFPIKDVEILVSNLAVLASMNVTLVFTNNQDDQGTSCVLPEEMSALLT